jgi:hypothetical protein
VEEAIIILAFNLIFYGGIGGLCFYLLRQNNQKSKATWRNFAARKNFKFTAGFWGTDAKIEGDYQGYQLTLEAPCGLTRRCDRPPPPQPRKNES